MTLRTALVTTRRRRLRPEGYGEVAGAVIAFLVLVLMIRFGANVYLGATIGSEVATSPPGTFFALVNTVWASLFLATVAPLISYRGISRTARNRRLAYFPVGRPSLLRAVAAASVHGVPTIAPAALAILSLIPELAAGRVDVLVGFSAAIVVATLSFFLVLTFIWWQEPDDGHLELIEVGLMAALILANPDFVVKNGRPVLVLFMHFRLGPDDGTLLTILPALGAAAATVAVAAASLFRRGTRRGRGGRSPGFALYRARIPTALVAATYAVEMPIILTNPALHTTVRNVVLLMLGLRLLWFLSFVFRTEQAIGTIVRAPAERRARLSVYWPPAAVHCAACFVPVAVYVIRVLVS